MDKSDKSRRTQVAAFLVAVALVLSAGYLLAVSHRGSTLTTSSTSTVSTTSTASSLTVQPSVTSGTTAANSSAIDITDMYADVVTSGEQAPTSNSSTVYDKSTYSGPSGGTFDVLFDALYQGCLSICPAQVTGVTVETPGFTVIGTIPSMPVPFQGNGAGPMNMEATFTVEVMAPSTPYTGTLTLIADAE